MARSASAATGGLPLALAAVFWVVDGLAHGLQAAAQELLGHGDLLGPQRRQHGVAVHGRRRCGGTLAAGRAPVALAGPAPAGAARAAAAAASGGRRARRARRAAARRRGPRDAAPRRPPRRAAALAVVVAAAACPSRGRGSPTRPAPASGVPFTSIRPSVFSGERAGFAAVERQDLDALEPDLDVGPQHGTDRLARPAPGRPSTVPLGWRAPAARQVHDPSPVWLVSSMSIRRDMRRTRYLAWHRLPMPGPDRHPVTWAGRPQECGSRRDGQPPTVMRCDGPMSLQEDPHE